MSTIYICAKCEGPTVCTLILPEDRKQFPIYCVPDEQGIIRSPEWREVPDLTQKFHYVGTF